MTSVGKILKQLSNIEMEMKDLSSKSSEIISSSDVQTLQSLFQQLEQLQSHLHGMQAKFGQFDPISGGSCIYFYDICVT